MDADETVWAPSRPFSRALVVVAHPDDAEFGAGATIALWADMGTDVRYVILTDGASGSADPGMTRERLAVIRQDEQRAACRRLGVGDIAFLGYPDGYLEPSLDARRKVAAEIRRHRPEAVMAPDPTVRLDDVGLRQPSRPPRRRGPRAARHQPGRVDAAVGPVAARRRAGAVGRRRAVADGLRAGGDPGGRDRHVRPQARRAGVPRLAVVRVGPEPRMREVAAQRGGQVGLDLAEAFTVLRFRVLDEEGSEPAWDKPPTNVKPVR